jgi:hypothetical protein
LKNLTGQARGQGFKSSSEMIENYKDLKVWQKSYELCLEIYRITAKFQIEKGELGTLRKDIAEIERMLKALIKSLKNKPLNP